MGWFLSFYVLHSLKFLPSFSLIFQGQEETRDIKIMDRTLENYVARIYTSAFYQGRNRRVDELLYDFLYHRVHDILYIKM